MDGNDVGAGGRLDGRCRVTEALGFNPAAMPLAGIDHRAHAEGVGKARDLAANIAVAKHSDEPAFQLPGREILQVAARIETAGHGAFVQQVERQIRQEAQDRLHHHLRGGAAVDAGRVHQRRRAAGTRSAAPGAGVHVARARPDPNAALGENGVCRHDGRRSDHRVVQAITRFGDEVFGGVQVRPVNEVDTATADVSSDDAVAIVERAAGLLDVSAHLGAVRPAVRPRPQAHQVADEDPVGPAGVSVIHGFVFLSAGRCGASGSVHQIRIGPDDPVVNGLEV